jgi:hypothetical protein
MDGFGLGVVVARWGYLNTAIQGNDGQIRIAVVY